MVSLKPERKLKKERLEETMIQQTSFERKTGEQVSALVQTLKRMIAGESDSDVYDLKECKALDISSTMPSLQAELRVTFCKKRDIKNKQSSKPLMTNSTIWLNKSQNLVQESLSLRQNPYQTI